MLLMLLVLLTLLTRLLSVVGCVLLSSDSFFLLLFGGCDATASTRVPRPERRGLLCHTGQCSQSLGMHDDGHFFFTFRLGTLLR